MNRSELAYEMMKIVFSRVGGSRNLEQARAYVAGLSPQEAEQIKAEAMAAHGA